MSFKVQKLLNYWATTSWLPATVPFLTLRVTSQNYSTSGRKQDKVMFLFIIPLITQLGGFQFQPGSCNIYLCSWLPHIQINSKYICAGSNYVIHIQSSQTRSLFQQMHAAAESNCPLTQHACSTSLNSALLSAITPRVPPNCSLHPWLGDDLCPAPHPLPGVSTQSTCKAHCTSHGRCTSTLRSRKRSVQVWEVKD